MQKSKMAIIFGVLLIAVGGSSFYAGMEYQQSKNPRLGNFPGGRGGQFQQGARAGIRSVSGEIIGKDEKSITVKLQDGSSKIVMLSDKTVINKAAAGTADELTTGERVMVLGQENSDGSVTAQNIQLNPNFGPRPTPDQ